MIGPEESNQARLYPYQQEAVEWLAQKKCALLALEMRLGKTPVSIRAADTVVASPLLILCPAIARQNWSRELVKFSTRTWNTCTLLSARDAKNITGADAIICSYDLLQRPVVASQLRARSYGVLILDEAHYLKSPDAARSTAVLGKAGLVHRADRVWALTGTPAPNNFAELWVLLRVFGVYRGTYDAFVKEFCTGYTSPYGFKITGNKNHEKLQRMLAPIMLRRLKKDVRPDLPKAQFSDIVVEPRELDIVDLEVAFTSHMRDPRGWKGLDIDIAAQRAMFEQQFLDAPTEDAKLDVLNRAVGHTAMLRRYTGMLKVRPVLELLQDELENGLKKVVVFAYHKAVMESLRDGLAKYGAVTLYGGTPPEKRQKHIDKFKADKNCRVFVANYVAAGTAIDLSAASDVLFVEYDWVPSTNAQAAARVDGPNQTDAVSVRFVGLAGSLDEKITRTVARKTKDLALLFDEPSASLFS